MALEPLKTADGSGFPLCRQISVFLENRVGELLRLTRLFEGEDVNILAVSVEGSVDCAIVRLLVNDPDLAHQMLTDAGFAITETDVLVVELPPGRRGILTVCAALISAEVNINYLYPLLPGSARRSCMAIQTDNPSSATTVLEAKNFRVLDQRDL
ncbi:MAG: acetolactate synthase [Phycisphaerae bacterium]|jgi:hypothetical protein|nr:acetolactate synthase [Phycisphaerae bacterium]MCZ2398661.1 acetolactate synthase [Phycisphaerae bacterium]